MTLDECLLAFRQLNKTENIGTFQSRFARLLKTLPDRWNYDESIVWEFNRAYRRAEREQLFASESMSFCTCGHEREWHHPQSLHCETCDSCSVFTQLVSNDNDEEVGPSPVIRATTGPMVLPSANPWDDKLADQRAREQQRRHESSELAAIPATTMPVPEPEVPKRRGWSAAEEKAFWAKEAKTPGPSVLRMPPAVSEHLRQAQRETREEQMARIKSQVEKLRASRKK